MRRGRGTTRTRRSGRECRRVSASASEMGPPRIARVLEVCGSHEKEFEIGTVKSVIVRRRVLPEALSEVVAREEEKTKLLMRTILSAAELDATKEVTY